MIFPIAFAAVISTTTPSNQNPRNDEIVYALSQQFEERYPDTYQIAQCESGDRKNNLPPRQFRADGTPVESPTHDFGIMQINAPQWDKTAKLLGLDYKNSWQDNIKMAKIVYNRQGFGAWVCASKVGVL